MDTFQHLVKAILVIVILYVLALLMRRRGTLTEEHSMVLARIVIDLCLPAIIFVSLADNPFDWINWFRPW
jgi:predicted permease